MYEKRECTGAQKLVNNGAAGAQKLGNILWNDSELIATKVCCQYTQMKSGV